LEAARNGPPTHHHEEETTMKTLYQTMRGLAAVGICALTLVASGRAQAVALAPQRYLVPTHVAGVTLRPLSTSYSNGLINYVYGTETIPSTPADPLPDPGPLRHSGVWYVVTSGLDDATRPDMGGLLVRALAAIPVRGWNMHSYHTTALEGFVQTNGHVCFAMAGTDAHRLAINVLAGQADNNCGLAQRRADTVALWVRAHV
jgi:hypothetical protein